MEERLPGRLTPRVIVAAQCLVAATIPAHADAVSDFYKGKTLSLIAGFPPGGGYDTYVRVLARHFGRFIPGQPLVVASNMPGRQLIRVAVLVAFVIPNFISVIAWILLLGPNAGLINVFLRDTFSIAGAFNIYSMACRLKWQGWSARVRLCPRARERCR